MERKKIFPLMSSTSEDVFSLDGKELKKPLNIEDQIRQMIHHGVTFTPQEESEAYLMLQEINYYRLSIFRHLQGEDKSFSRIVKLYDFDEWLRNELMKLTNPIEELVRTKLAYYLSLNYPDESIGLTSIDCPPALCYLDDRIISPNRVEEYEEWLKRVYIELERNKHRPDVSHYIKYYNGFFPFWVLIEYISFGSLSKFIDLLNEKILSDFVKTSFIGLKTKETCEDGYIFSQWINVIRQVRNYCAHLMRVYRVLIAQAPSSKPFHARLQKYYKEDLNFNRWFNRSMGVALLIFRAFYTIMSPKRVQEWNSFINRLNDRIVLDRIDESFLGFPRFEKELFLI